MVEQLKAVSKIDISECQGFPTQHFSFCNNIYNKCG